MAVHLAFLSPLFFVYWLIGDTTIFEYSWLWSLAGVATVLVLAREKKHSELVLGLCSLAFWLKVEPFLALYLLTVSGILFAILRLPHPKRRHLFLGVLCLFTIVLPKCLPFFFAAKPVLWLWLRESLLLGFFIRYLWYERESHNGKLAGQRFFEHLGYILFIPQLLKLLNFSPSGQSGKELEHPGNFWPAAKIFLLGSAKLCLYHIHLLIPMGLQAGAAGTFVPAWYQILTHYLLWFLWLSAHYDFAVAVARLLGVYVPSNFHFPLLAVSPGDFWRRWHVLHHRFLQEWVYLPLGGNRHPAVSITCTFLFSALVFSALWIGSLHWLPGPAFFQHWLPFFMVQAFLVYAQQHWLPDAPTLSFPRRAAGWIFTQCTFACSCLFLAGLNRFPLDTVPASTAWLVFRKALFLD